MCVSECVVVYHAQKRHTKQKWLYAITVENPNIYLSVTAQAKNIVTCKNTRNENIHVGKYVSLLGNMNKHDQIRMQKKKK